jgi:short-subunit dehydrogenase
VTALCPGPVPTEFQARSGMTLPSAAKIFELPPGRVAQIGYDGFMRGKRVVIAGTANKIGVFLMRFTPHALLLRAIDQRSQGKGGD